MSAPGLLERMRPYARPAARRLRPVVRRAAGQARSTVGLARLCGFVLALRLRRRRVYVLVAGAETAPLRTAARCVHFASGLRAPAELVVMDYSHDPAAAAALAGAPAGVAVRRFWRDAAPDGGGATPRYSPHTAGVPEPHPGALDRVWDTGYYRAGRPVMTVTERGRTTVVDHYQHGSMPSRRDEIDERGRLVRAVDLHPGTGRAVTHRYLDTTGRCWMSVWIDPDGSFGRAQRHHPATTEFSSLRTAQAEWLASLLETERRYTVLAVGADAVSLAEMVGAPYRSVRTAG
ncbi:hypothetical protein H0B56_06710 [Haloechinothrix sp. YIM 98757]|uniref:Uncharacterized protein n=1 Tax=Haloechinothrix aidingensis TaxID=2752311 RepID=A0A838A7M7_9PSEU|nr:hypothetical protein [Haloechinothrix aidingensis]MBA0125228.1 hypothetical protein [Haloechinothrix aidingensis]